MSWAVLEPLLTLTDEGLEAITTQRKYGVVISHTRTSMPASYNVDTNRCELNFSLKSPTLASYFVHEMVHAHFYKGGWISDFNELSQSDYVAEMVTEEYIATTRQYQFFVTLDVKGQLPGVSRAASDMPPRYAEYRSAYDYGVKRARRVTSDASRLHLLGIINANQLLKYHIREGGLGVGIFSYREYYGREWQKNKNQKNKLKKP